ncbi:hypothetical protein [Streptomyces sp. NPDC001435]|uniref:hypothetical protein n=1 Tax=unclassified Streptomyces TaxID=2593676 RepID=UPI0036A7DC3C
MNPSENVDERDEWDALSEGARPSEGVAQAWLSGLGLNRAAPVEVLVRLLDAGQLWFLYCDGLPPGVLDAAVEHPARRIRLAAAESGRLSPAQWDRLLAVTPGQALREVLEEMAAEQAVRRPWTTVGRGIERPPHPDAQPPTTPSEIAVLADAVPHIGQNDRTYALWWVAALYENPDAMRQLAASPKRWIRRSVARAPRLPKEVVSILARDEDRVVHLFLAESCDDAPAEMLLDVWTWWSGSFSFPGRPRNHPNFPRHDLLRFADDPRPRVRLLALDDPDSPDELVERFSHDPDPDVRARAAADPRLSTASAVRLAGDTEYRVHQQAWQNAALPPTVLVTLLLDERSADKASQNPAIPVASMHRMITAASPPS